MIPNSQTNLNDFEFIESSSKTFKINDDRIYNYVDEVEAVKQAIYLMLNIERYEHLIYSWDYGIELKDLYGQDSMYVQAELERRITEALTQDSRITDVTDFEFTKNKNKLFCTFTVKTIYGNVQSEKSIGV